MCYVATFVNEGRPEEISTSTSTIAPSSPTRAQLITLASIIQLILYHKPVERWNVATTLVRYDKQNYGIVKRIKMSSDAIIWIAVGSIATACIVILNTYLLFFRPWWQKPKFTLDFEMVHPYCGDATSGGFFGGIESRATFWLRVRVENTGRSIAKTCLVKLIKIMDRDGNPVKPFDPTRLHWVATPWEAVPFSSITLNREDYEYVDVLVTQEGIPCILICGDQFVWAKYEGRAILKHLDKGCYILQITAYGENVNPETKYLTLKWSGTDFKKGVLLEIHDSFKKARTRCKEYMRC